MSEFPRQNLSEKAATVFVVVDDEAVRKALARLIRSAGMTAPTETKIGIRRKAKLVHEGQFIAQAEADLIETVPVVRIDARADWRRLEPLLRRRAKLLVQCADDQHMWKQ
jgi:hypothetical protein